jgi:iron complex outermembrane receptor protein
VGIKADLSQRLSATLAAYQIKKTNVLVTDPDNPDFSIQTGEQTSQGIEFNLVGRPLNGWDISLSYAYTDAVVSKDTDSTLVNQTLVGVPNHQLGLWTRYELQRGSLKGLGLGLGLYYTSETQGELPNTDLQIPGYFRVDAALFYKRNNWKVQLNVKNLTNAQYYKSNGFWIVPQAPLTVLGTIAVEF